MLRNRPYSLLSALFGCIFCIFTVGIPVVLASCPMANHDTHERPSCCSAQSEASQPVLRAYKNTSCCTTTFVATRSTQEYLQSGEHVTTFDAGHNIGSLLTSVAPATDDAFIVPARRTSASPPIHRLILPIVHSSLLI